MRDMLIKSIKYGNPLEMVYMSNEGIVSKRRIHVSQVDGYFFKANCHLRKAKRTFKIDHILALRPIYEKERMVI